jgi:phosphoglycerol transferase MdoB-like AlkP superfamily enzyme
MISTTVPPAALVIWTWVAAFILVRVVHIGANIPVSIGLMLSSAALPALVVALAPTRFKRGTTVTVVTAVTLFALANAAFHRFFGDWLPLTMIGAITQVPKVGGYVTELISPGEWAVAVAVVVVTVVVARRRTADRGRLHYTITAAVCTLMALPAVVFATVVWRSSPGTPSGGFLYAALADAQRTAREQLMRDAPTATDLESVRQYVARDSVPPTDAWFGSVAGSSVLMIQVESLNAWMLDAQAGGRPTMPVLRALAARGVTFTQIYDATASGRSSDADYLVMASQHPLRHGALAMTRPSLEMIALPSVLAQRAYTTLSADGMTAGFWNAGQRRQHYGFGRSLFAPDLGGKNWSELGLQDRDFLRAVAPAVAKLDRPYLAWLITLSMHGPHDALPPGATPALAQEVAGPFAGTPLGNYLVKARMTDQAVGALLATLDSSGALANTTVVVYGDHPDRFGFDRGALLRAAHIADGGTVPPDLEDLRLSRVPMVIVPPGRALAGQRGTRVETAGTLLDVAPTLLHLLGIRAPAAFLGRSLVPPASGFAANVAGVAIDGERLWTGAACYTRGGAALPTAACDALRARARAQLEVSALITRYAMSKLLR